MSAVLKRIRSIDPWMILAGILLGMSIYALTVGCGLLQAKTTEVVAEKVEERAVALGLKLKQDYDIDVSRDPPQVQVLKIIKVEAARGNGQLASLLADVSKVKTLGEALSVVAAHHQLLLDKVKRGEASQEAVEAAQRAAQGLGGLAGLTSLAGILAWLRGKGFKEAATFLAEKIESAGAAGMPASEIKEMARAPLPGEERAAATVAALVKARFPTPTKKPAASVAPVPHVG